MSSSIYDPFVVTNLPRLPPKTSDSKICTTSKINESNSNTFDISISGSFLGTFITRPSPKMIWSYALSPQAIVNAMDSFDHELNTNNNNSIGDLPTENDKKFFAVGLTERNKQKIKFITYGRSNNENELENESNENQSTSAVNEEDRASTESDHLKEVKDKTIVVKNEVVGLQFSNNGDKVFSLHINGEVSIWSFAVENNNENEDLKPIKTYEQKSLNKQSKIIFHKFVKPEDLKIDSRLEKIETLLLTVEKSSSNKKQNSLTVCIYALALNEILEISSSIIENIGNFKIELTYDPSGKLIILEDRPELTLHSFKLPFTSKYKTIRIDGIFNQEPVDFPASIMAVSTNRVLVTKGSTVALIDIQYGALLSSLDLYSKSKEINGNAKPPRTATLLNIPVVNGNSLRSKETFALVLLKNTKENYAQIQHVSIDVGLGKLKDVLGKSLPINDDQTKNRKEFVGFAPLIANQNFSNASKEIDLLNKRADQISDELTKVYSGFKNLKSEGRLEELETKIISFLKQRSIEQNDDEFKVFEIEHDRIVDPKFFRLVTVLLFKYNEKLDKLSLDESYIPETGLTYVLTHPLFPSRYTSGLLKVLEQSPRLVRQAIVTCVNIPCRDLIEQLSIVDDEDIFKDVIARLIDEFSTDTITKETIKLIKKKQSSTLNSEQDFDLDRIIHKILTLNYGYEILNSFIDSNGLVLSLHYSKDESQLEKLMKKTQLKIESLAQDTQLLALVNQALSIAEQEQVLDKKKQKKNKKRGKKSTSVADPGDIEVEQSKLDMILSVGGKGSKLLKDSASKSIVTYTIDRLTI